MIDVFTLCLQMAYTFKGSGISPHVHNDDRLCRPLKKYIADYIWRLVLGLAPHSMALAICGLLQKIGINIESEINLGVVGAESTVSLEELCRKGADKSIKSNLFSVGALNRATSLCFNLDFEWRKKQVIQHLQRMIQFQNESLNRTRQLITAHFWLHEEHLTPDANSSIMMKFQIVNKNQLLVKLRKSIETLNPWRTTIQKVSNEMNSFVMAIKQRLKWAVGANPSIQDMRNQFIETIQIKRNQLEHECHMAAFAIKNCTAILNYEKLRRSNKESLDCDQEFLNLISRWEKSCIMAQSCINAVTPIEEKIVELLDPEGKIEETWLRNVSGLIDAMTEQIQMELAENERDILTLQENLHICAQKLRVLMGRHHQMASDIRNLLRTILKIDGIHSEPIKEYLMRYKQFVDIMSELHENVLSKDFTEEVVARTLDHILKVLQRMNYIYNDLLLIENGIKEQTYSASNVDGSSNVGVGTSNTNKINAKGKLMYFNWKCAASAFLFIFFRKYLI